MGYFGPERLRSTVATQPQIVYVVVPAIPECSAVAGTHVLGDGPKNIGGAKP